MNQSFTPDQLIKLCKRSELIHYKISKEDLENELKDVYNQISNGTYQFELKKNNEYYLTEKLTDKLVLRKLNDNIKRIYKDRQADRRIIVKQVKTLLEDKCDIWVLRTDISKFYESINRSQLIDKFKSDAMLSYFSNWLLNKLFQHPLLVLESGIPRGMPISATLSEMYMRPFDKWIHSYSQAYFYARFVDDIIIFSHRKETILEINKNLDEKLKQLKLLKNKDKTKIHSVTEAVSTFPLEFLGYHFKFEGLGRKRRILKVSVAKKKINKIKTRIALSFRDYTKTKDFILLKKRIRFLTGNYRVKSTIDDKNLMAGIYYNYNHVTELKCFEELNIFLYKTITCKQNSLGKKLETALTNVQRRTLINHCFKKGFENKIYHRFTLKDLLNIKNCWQ